MTRYVFVTGGVVSGLGKGVATASLAAILLARNLRVNIVKMDPYINLDPGTMNPEQHGEVYVTEDGAETDLDLGHYERMTNLRMRRSNNFTAGSVYEAVIRQERRGEFGGQTVQVIPHITDEIKSRIRANQRDAHDKPYDIVIVETGGTVGDIESQPFLEAIRQIRIEEGSANVLYVHLTLIPRLSTGEVKTKPTQHSVKELRSIGLQPDILLCRCGPEEMPSTMRDKIALFTDVDIAGVVSLVDVDSIYLVPQLLNDQGLDDLILRKFNIDCPKAELQDWKSRVRNTEKFTRSTQIGLVGKYVESTDAYKSLLEAITHAGLETETKVEVIPIKAEELEVNGAGQLETLDAILVPGGFGQRGLEGKIKAARFARENNRPYLGICYGLQVAMIEFARNVLQWEQANSAEIDPDTPQPVIALAEEWEERDGELAIRDHKSDLGGTMRLGLQDCKIEKDSLAFRVYGKSTVSERHRHRYEVNNRYREHFAEKGMRFTGVSKDQNLIEMIELPNLRWFLACQFHPEFSSTMYGAHPIFRSFIEAASIN
ncbi:MAG: CTP synthase [Gammaproteobacteria bacterium]|nr:CTP synthase [Gammaproteobacteria bacterium]